MSIIQFLSFLVLHCPVIYCASTSPPDSTTSRINDQSLEIDNEIEIANSCDPLHAEGTSVLCFPPVEPPKQGFDDENSTDCSEPSVPGTIASYSCKNFRGVVYSGFLNCAKSGVWITSFTFANNSLCNLDAAILNFELPDVVISTGEPEFTTPLPNSKLLRGSNKSALNDYEKTALHLHNIFRQNHGTPLVKMSKQLNKMAQVLAESIVAGTDMENDIESQFKLSPIHRTMNIEMNWYFQVPSSPNSVQSVSNAIQSWYSGFAKYDWENIDGILEDSEALGFSRVVWKNTQLIGVGVRESADFTFVLCIYTPGRNIESIDPVNEFKLNVLPFKVG